MVFWFCLRFRTQRKDEKGVKFYLGSTGDRGIPFFDNKVMRIKISGEEKC
jgi:hypothetical protein